MKKIIEFYSKYESKFDKIIIILTFIIPLIFLALTLYLGIDNKLIKKENNNALDFILFYFIIFGGMAGIFNFLKRFEIFNPTEKKQNASKIYQKLETETKDINKKIDECFENKDNKVYLNINQLMKFSEDIKNILQRIEDEKYNTYQKNDIEKLEENIKKHLLYGYDKKLKNDSIFKNKPIEYELLNIIYEIPKELRETFNFIVNNDFSIKENEKRKSISNFFFIIEKLELKNEEPYKNLYSIKKYVGEITSHLINKEEIESLKNIIKEKDFDRKNENTPFELINDETNLLLKIEREDKGQEKELTYKISINKKDVRAHDIKEIFKEYVNAEKIPIYNKKHDNEIKDKFINKISNYIKEIKT